MDGFRGRIPDLWASHYVGGAAYPERGENIEIAMTV